MSGDGDALAQTPIPPYYAVIFSSQASTDTAGYTAMATRMIELAAEQPGFLGIESARGEDGLGLTISYWENEEAIAAWKRNAEHQVAQRRGREQWYAGYEVRVARVERAYGMPSRT
ncbi:MAG: antibiotic biosynthesis monooxygenase [Gemmatimonadota bacterium]